MPNRMLSLLERTARVRRMIEAQSQNGASWDLQLLRPRSLSFLIRRHLEKCIELAVPSRPAVALVPIHRGASARCR